MDCTLHICQPQFGIVPRGVGIRNNNGCSHDLCCFLAWPCLQLSIRCTGGLSAVAWTDVIQVVFLVLGGLITTYLALDILSDGAGFLVGFNLVLEGAPEKFHMILDKSNNQYKNLPGIWVLIGGLWVANIYYWGFNQYIIQRTLAAKSLLEKLKMALLWLLF